MMLGHQEEWCMFPLLDRIWRFLSNKRQFQAEARIWNTKMFLEVPLGSGVIDFWGLFLPVLYLEFSSSECVSLRKHRGNRNFRRKTHGG